ncbi:hypothetical protein CSA56_07975 [candidate division KSB3 bacterium]|uniref:HAD family hydrolase n=1 Tax=candidate division KSB3 bacterium TaxID=2044937 RepID=A0A2G6KF61_9BACT|nr:MAG: hypothetical protein CSA56_07975 [candidate division KSB3 bacterium]
MTIQAVFFDMGGTIDTHYHDRASSLQTTEYIRHLLSQAGLDMSGIELERLYDSIREGLTGYRIWRENTMIELPPERIWREFALQNFSIAPHQLDDIAEELALTADTRYLKRQMRPEMPEALEAIQRMGLKLGVISNVQSRGQVPKNLEQYKLLHYFDPIVLSSEYGWRKPDPSIFHHAASLAQVPTSACVYVGDRISRDILGARKAGYAMAVQILHDYKEGDDPVEPAPDAVIEDMRQLVNILKQALQHAKIPREHDHIKAILFDASDVLYFRPHPGRWLQPYLENLGLAYHALPSDRLHELKTRAFQREIGIEEYYNELLTLYGVQGEEHLKAGRAILEQESDAVEIFEGVKDTLIQLKERGFLLGIVTDTVLPIAKKLRWFERGGFVHVWDAVISSCDIGIRKPNPAMYEAALQQLGVASEEAVFIGHDASEIQGAEKVGLTTVAFNYDDDAHADLYVEHFTDLLTLSIFS